ncbi:MAG: methionine ABC transporter ATP-binding protein [Ancrocorticia sp.]|uniref:methionine ABC transporter ATP-binding protein n=1 Tax=Ancrocorticia sp. TaxID=2593684 RepID=UPI003F939C8E
MISISHASKTFRGKAGTVEALKDVSLDVNAGEIFGIIGFSGAGKSTLVRLVNQLESPDTGTVSVDGQDLTALGAASLRQVRRDIGMVFQQFNLLERKSVYHNVAMPLVLAGAPKETIKQRVEEVLAFVELEDKRNTYVSQLSGGQKQRVGIARALATEPKILLCDEATSALDPKTTESILALLKKINQSMGVTILLITHQMHVIQRICTKVAVMEDGRIVEQGSVLDVFDQPRETITQEFVRTVLNDQIPSTLLDQLESDTRNYRVERMRFVGETARKPVLAQLSRIPDLEVNILGANVEELQDTVLCLYMVQLIGETSVIEAAERYIDEQGVRRERVSA